MRIVIVFNPRSGPRAASVAISAVVEALASHNHVLEVIDCAMQPDFEREIRKRAEVFDRAIVIGGDGTLNGVVNAIMLSTKPDLPVAFVPTGRGKDTARSLPSWRATDMAGGVLEASDPHHIDLVHATLANGVERYAINMSSIGLSARAAEIANGLPRMFGTLSYVLGAARSMMPRTPFHLRMSIDGVAHEIDNALLISACNGRAFGGGVFIAPDAEMDDGLIDIVVAHNANLGDLARQLPSLKAGTLREHPALSRFRGKHVEIGPLPGMLSEADGEILSNQPTTFTCAHRALSWIAP